MRPLSKRQDTKVRVYRAPPANVHKPEINCMCGAREPDTGQTTPRLCWSCGRVTMGAFA